MQGSEDLIDFRMADGSRHFAEITWRPPLAIRGQLSRLPGVTVTSFLTSLNETWIDFHYGGQSFTVNNPLHDYWLFVRDPNCPDELLRDVQARLA